PAADVAAGLPAAAQGTPAPAPARGPARVSADRRAGSALAEWPARAWLRAAGARAPVPATAALARPARAAGGLARSRRDRHPLAPPLLPNGDPLPRDREGQL